MVTYEQPVLYSVDFSGCTVLSSSDAATLSATFIDALRRAGATIVETVSHEFSGKGLTCVLILAESHAVLHTWPETGTANVDIFSCSSRLKSLAAIDALKTAFGAHDVSIQTIARADGHRRSAAV
ncbi:MAG: adenosylmethionine decarboxylase [Acidobacteria bacterium]|nr:adenosylmethionine decarboxylase [Acidobacteriota bacterium]